jgi:hypothetical protein
VAPPPRPNVLRGIARVARGRPDGLNQFSGTVQGFLVSLAPLLAFPLVGTLLVLGHGGGAPAISDFLATVAVLLAPAVLSFEFARLWRREAYWLRFATAFNWCQWVLPVLAAVLVTVLGALLHAGLPRPAAPKLLVLCLAGYGLWMHWFLARHGLALSRLRAALLVAGVNLGTAVLVVMPRLLLLHRI